MFELTNYVNKSFVSVKPVIFEVKSLFSLVFGKLHLRSRVQFRSNLQSSYLEPSLKVQPNASNLSYPRVGLSYPSYFTR